jgi:uncharacterized protein (TIGR02117 family)
MVLTVALLIVRACSTKPHVVKTTEIIVPSATEVYVVRHGWHTGFVIPAAIIQSRLPDLISHFGDTPFIEFGWGDKSYYQSEEKSLGLTLRAVLWPTDSIVYTRAVPEEPVLYFADSEIEVLCLEDQQYALLVSFIENSFYRDIEGSIIFTQAGPLENSLFFKGIGEYYLFNTCNTWTARGLKSAGLDISPAFKVQAGGVMHYLSKNTSDITLSCEAQLADAAVAR